MSSEKNTPRVSGGITPKKNLTERTPIKNEECIEEDQSSTYNYSDESKKAILALKKAYEEKDFTEADKIIDDMVTRSMVAGLKKLHTAAGYGFAELVEKYIKEDKIDPNVECAFNDLTCITPLHFCSGIGPDPISPDRAKCIEILVDNGANVNQFTSRKDTPLHWATKLADYSVCDMLIKKGADLSLVNTDNCTCAHGAAFYKNLDILELLLDLKVDANIKDISGKNILHLLCKDSIETLSFGDNDVKSDKKQKHKQLINLIERLLKEFKIDPNCKDIADFTPLMFASEHGDIEVIEKLIEFKADINMSNSEGKLSKYLILLVKISDRLF
jgi:ankyrin repeat protein